jgi:hypothetical protein
MLYFVLVFGCVLLLLKVNKLAVNSVPSLTSSLVHLVFSVSLD